MRKTVWITGASGFSGRHLIKHLRGCESDLNIVGLDCREAEVDGLDALHVADLTQFDKIRELIRGCPPSRVYHLAGLLPPSAEGELWRVNVGCAQNLILALASEKVFDVRVLGIGSAAEYLSKSTPIAEESPCGGTSAYGRTKWAQTIVSLEVGRQHGIHVSIARTFNLLGPGLPGSLVAGSICAQLAQGAKGDLKVGNLKPRRDFVDIRDAVSAYHFICEHGKAGGIYNVCRGTTTSIETILDYFLQASAQKPRKVTVEAGKVRKADLDKVCGDNSKLLSLGWKPRVSIRRSVADMLEAAVAKVGAVTPGNQSK